MANDSRDPRPTIDYHPALDAAQLAGISPSRLRRYEGAGLLTPARHRGRIRLYSETQVAELRRIRRLNDELGVNLAGIDIILRLVDEVKTLRAAAASVATRRFIDVRRSH